MASRSPSRSEGEVLSSDSEAKANTSRSSRNDTRVDRHTRTYAAPRSPTSRSRRSRSRSPYRASRGEKRRRDDDPSQDQRGHDPRTFHVRYEDDHRSHHRRGSHGRHDPKRARASSRSRSRSPFRAKDKARDRPYTDRRDRARDSRAGTEEAAASGPVIGTGQNKAKDSASSKKTAQAEGNEKTLSTNAPEVPTIDALAETAAMAEATLIEERRRRREAIKNKYRGQATPLLVQALHLGVDSSRTTPGPESNPATPGPPSPASPSQQTRTSDSREGSPVVGSPQPSLPSDPQSPAQFNFANDDNLANGEAGSPAADEPSAADYDPTADMQDERARHDKRLFKEDDQSIDNADKQVLDNKEDQPAEASKPSRAEFDMFADDDDEENMFAEAAAKPKTETKAAQALDVKMMDNWDDSEGYYITILGELIENRYHVTQPLGRGMFSSVVRAEDSKTKQPVAIKIVRNNESMRKAGIKEMDILKDLAANDPDDRKHVIRLLRSFDHKGHLCMVFENLSLNLREVLKKFGRDVGINVKAIRAYTQQLFLGLSLMKKCQYLHADLKPDNILVNDARNIVKICDLGSASPITENATAPYLVSRFYRAPEVILGIPYDYGIDMWSVGCTLFELYTGKILFTGRNNNNMLRSIMECRGKFPHKLLRRGTLTLEYFDDLLNFRSQETDKTTGRIVTKLIDVKSRPIRDLRSRLIPKGKRMDEQERKELELLLDLLDKCLDLRPEKRITPNDALKHPFLVRAK